MRTLATLLVLASLTANAQTGNADVFDQFFRYVEPRGRPSAVPSQNESVDLFTGTLRINVVEFAFPGVGGLDLSIVRNYTSRLWSRVDGANGAFVGDLENSALGIGWSMHFGRLRNPLATGQLLGCGGGDYPVFEDADGSARSFYPVGGAELRSRDHWKMVRNCSLTGGGTGTCITDTQGRIREFSSTNQYYVGLSLVYPLARIRDVHGNAISATYRTEGKINVITDSVGRTVTFNYLAGTGCPASTGCLRSIEARRGVDSRLITYSYQTVTPAETYGAGRYVLPGARAFLSAATPPAGPGVSYTYRINDPIAGNQFAIKQITNEYGSTSILEYGLKQVWTGAGSIPMAMVTKRTIDGPSLPSMVWGYDYSHPSNLELATTTVTRPDALVDTYNFYGFGGATLYGQSGRVWRVGLQRSVSRAGGLETETLDWEPGAVIANANYSSPAYASQCPAWAWDTDVRNPYVRTRTVTRNLSRYETSVTQVDVYGQPTLIVETGERPTNKKVRERRITYDYRTATNQLIGRVSTDDSCVGSNCIASCPTNCLRTSHSFAGLNGLPDSETTKGVVTQFTYYADGSLKTVTDANAKTMTLTYDSGQPSTFAFGPSLASLSLSRSYEWDGQLRTLTTARQFTTTYGHDAAGRVNRVTPPAGNDETIIAYDPSGRIVTETRGTGLTALITTRTRDGLGREIQVSNNLNELTTSEFDSMGRRIFQSLPRLSGEPELGVRSEYDGLGRATRTTQRFVATGHRPLLGACSTPGACETTFTFLQNHCVETAVARSATDTVKTTSCFESFGDPSNERLEKITDAKSGNWSYQYDVASNLTDFTAPMSSGNRSFRFAPTTFFPTTSTTAARGTTTTTSHDGLGNPRAQVDARGVNSTLEYDDPLSRLTALNYPTFTQESSKRTYEGHLLKTVYSTGGGSYTYDYDSLDRVRVITWTFLGRTYTTNYHYDNTGCLDRVTYPTGSVFVMTCDREGRPTSVMQELSGGATQTIVSTATYNAIGRATSATYGNGKVVTTGFLNGRIDTIGSPGVMSLKYSYDGADNVVSVTDGQNPSNNAGPITYDSLDRLRTVATPAGAYDFDYDAMGNRLYADSPGQPRTTYTYNPTTGRLETSNGPSAPAPMTLSWSAGERIATSSDGSTYVYDALGRRVRKTQPSASLDVVFHYDSSGHLLAETDALGNRIREYVYLQGQLVVTQGCLQGFSVTCTDRAWTYTDVVGTIVARTDSSSAVVRFDNKPWGAAQSNSEPRRFNGRWYDKGLDTYDFGARLYSPPTGRMLSTDPAWTPNNINHANSYSFTHNNPYKYSDPSGASPHLMVHGLSAGALTDYTSLVTPGPYTSANLPLIWKYLEAREFAYTSAVKSGYCPYPVELLVENASGPAFRFGSLDYPKRAATELVWLKPAIKFHVGDVTIDRRFLQSSSAELLAHAIVHETGHWAWWTNLGKHEADQRDLGRYWNTMKDERDYLGVRRAPNLPTEGIDAELHVFGVVK